MAAKSQPFSGSGDDQRRTGRSISVSGFDYEDNYYAAIETNGVITGYQGKKLIIEIPIEYIHGRLLRRYGTDQRTGIGRLRRGQPRGSAAHPDGGYSGNL